MSSYVIKDVRVFDGFNEQPGPQTVVIAEGQIQHVGSSSPKDLPANAHVIDGMGLTLMPGLIDAHTHVFRGEAEVKRALRAGVTTLFDMHNVPANGLYMKEQSLVQDEMPQIFTALHAATVDGGWPRAIVQHTNAGNPIVLESLKDYPKLASAQDAAAFVANNKKLGADFIKLMQESGECLTLSNLPAPTKELQAAVIGAAHRHDLLTFAHATNLRETLLVLDAGVDALAHQFFDQPHTDEVFASYKRNNSFVIPTLTAISSMMGLPVARDWADAPDRDGFVDAESRKSLCHCMKISKPGCSVEYAYACIKDLKANGIDIICGTDSGPSIHGTALGPAVHFEMASYVEKCDFTPEEALRSATGLSAARLRLNDRGQVAPGKRADLLLVRGNPLVNIGDTVNIVGVFKKGRLMEFASLGVE